MATEALSVYSDVMASKYEKYVPVFINTTIPLLNFFNQGKVIGKNYTFDSEDYLRLPLQDALNEGSAWSGEAVATPTARDSNYAQSYLSWKKLVGALRLTEESIDLTKGPNTFINGFKRAVQNMAKVTKLDIEAAIHGDGTGSLGTFVSDSSTTMTLDSNRFMRKYMYIDGYDNDSKPTKDIDAVYVSSVVKGSSTDVVCVGTISNGETDTKIYKVGSHSGSQNSARAANGISNIVDDDDGDFQGLDREDYPYMEGHVTDGATPGTNQALTLARMRTVCNNIVKGSYADTPDLIYTTIEVRDKFADLMINEHVPNQVMPSKIGWAGNLYFYYDGKQIPVYGSRMADPNTMFFLSKPSLFKYFGKMGWATQDGLLQRLAGYLTYEALWRGWLNFGSTWPEANGRLNDITE